MNTFKHILVPTDFSPSSSAAVELAVAMATQFDSELTLLHVWELPIYPYTELMMSSASITESVEKAATECLEVKLKEVQARLPRAKSLLKLGVPWEQILAALEESDADLIIMGTHGRRGFQRALLGSVAERIVRLSPGPVLTLHGPAAP